MKLNSAQEIANFIKNAKKVTPVKVYLNSETLKLKSCEDFKVFGSEGSYTIIGDYDCIMKELEDKKSEITDMHIEYDRRNSAIPLYNFLHEHARIEPGAFIRDFVTIEKNAVVMMGAVINVGAVIGEGSMVDMNAVIGARGTLGRNVHLGAGAVVAGVLEPPSATPVIIEDDAMIGANAVILEGVRVGKGAVVAAGSVVTRDVEPYTVVAGSPAKVIKMKDDQTKDKTKILEELRNLD